MNENIEHCIYSEYGVNIVSLGDILSYRVEPKLLQFCITYNVPIVAKSRDIRKLLKHFIASEIIEYCKHYTQYRNILNHTNNYHSSTSTELSEVIRNTVNIVLRKFSLCYSCFLKPLSSLNTDDLNSIKSMIDKCYITPKRLDKIKKFVQTNDLLHLSSQINNNPHIQMILSK